MVFFAAATMLSLDKANDGLTSTHISCFTAINENLFVGTNGGGVFMSTNNGSYWNAVNTGIKTVLCVLLPSWMIICTPVSGTAASGVVPYPK